MQTVKLYTGVWVPDIAFMTLVFSILKLIDAIYLTLQNESQILIWQASNFKVECWWSSLQIFDVQGAEATCVEKITVMKK